LSRLWPSWCDLNLEFFLKKINIIFSHIYIYIYMIFINWFWSNFEIILTQFHLHWFSCYLFSFI
jgi:hypothetical protein